MSDYKYLDIPYRRSKIHCHDNFLFDYFYKYLMEKVFGIFEFSVPGDWDKDYFIEHLLADGLLCVIKTDKYGIIPQECNISGWNIYKHPTNCTVSNSLIEKSNYRIGKDTEIIHFRADFSGLRDTVIYYADLLALTSESYKINQINTRKTAIMNVENKAQAETMKKAYDNLASGDSAVFVSYGNTVNGKPWQFFNENSAYIGTNLLNDLQTIENDFDTAIGLNTCNTQKKERLVVSEVESNNQSTAIKPLLWIETMSDCFTKVKAMFGVELSVKQRVSMEGDEPNEYLD